MWTKNCLVFFLDVQHADSASYNQFIIFISRKLATKLRVHSNSIISQGLMDKHFNYTGWESRPPIRKLLGDQALILVNSHHSVGYNFPRAPHVKEVGGINLRPLKPLPQVSQTNSESAKKMKNFEFGFYAVFMNRISSTNFWATSQTGQSRRKTGNFTKKMR